MRPLVAPFSGERYADVAGMAALVAPPYDVISPAGREELANGNPANVVHVTLPIGPDPHAAAARVLAGWREAGTLIRDPGDAVYVVRQSYSIDGEAFARTGVICAVSVEPYETGRVRPHEKTHAHIKEDRLSLLRSTATMCESLFFLAPDRAGDLKRLLAAATGGESDVKTELDGVGIELWRVSGEAGNAIAAAAGATHIYIADGHHRYETAWAYLAENEQATRTLALVVPLGDPGLVVLPTHRLIGGRSLTREDVESAVEKLFELRDLQQGESWEEELKHSSRTACGVALRDGSRLILELRREADLGEFARDRAAAVAALDVARIDALVVEPLVDAAGGAVSYSASLAEVETKLNGEAGVAVVLRATGVEDVIRVADVGAVMPQKATYFVPKVPSGMVFLELID